MASLYNLSEEYNQLLDMIESGEYSEEDLTDTIEMIGEEFDEKAINIALICREEAANEEKVAAEIKRLQALKNQYVNSQKRLRQYLLDQMVKTNKKVIKGALISLNMVLSPPKIDESNPKWKEEFVKWAQSNNRDDLLKFYDPDPDKSAIKLALSNGEDIPIQIIRENTIRIR